MVSEKRDVVIFLRQPLPGENSIEEFARRISRSTGAVVKVLPFDSRKISSMIKNIRFAKIEQGAVNHIANGKEGYLLPFIGGKRIITYHDLGTLKNSRNAIYKFFKLLFNVFPSRHFADAVTFVSEQTKREYIMTVHPKSLDNLFVIYNSYDERLVPSVNSAAKLNLRNDAPVILHVGTGMRKNLEGLILACEDLHIKLLIVGRLSEKQERLLSEKKIKFENLHDISFEQIVECYKKCDIVSFPTFYEGFGLPVIEAQVMRKPLISSDIEIIHEVGGDGVFYVDPNNIGSIRDGIIHLTSDKELCETLVAAGIENVKRFSNAVVMKQYKELYYGENPY